MSWQRAAIELAKRAATSPAGKKAAAALGGAIPTVLGKRGRDVASKRGARRLAIDLARQVDGQYSEGTIVGGRRRYVVWSEGEPIETFPTLDGDLTARKELQNFPKELLKDPPPDRGKKAHPPREWHD